MVTSLINRETAQHQLVITPHVHASCTAEGCAKKSELIDTRDDACEQARLRAVMVLFVVDDLMEMDDFH